MIYIQDLRDFWYSLPLPEEVTPGMKYAEQHFYTWDPNNPLNRLGPHASCVGLRCDHIFMMNNHVVGNKNPLRDFYPARSAIKLKGPRVLVESVFSNVFSSRLFTLSDHYASFVKLKRAPNKFIIGCGSKEITPLDK